MYRSYPAAVAVTIMIGLLLSGCGTISRPSLGDSDRRATETYSQANLADIRFPATDDQAFLVWYSETRAQRDALNLDGINALAISGGGANGAFGAGVLVGWTKAGTRPRFDIVTGVSTGALIAPFAFVGSAWDDQLAAAYHDPKLGRIKHGLLRTLFGPSLFDNGGLSQLINKYADARLLKAVAEEHDKGRRLLIATTNLDTQESVVWDMSAIAKQADSPTDHGEALRLFRSVLLASASIPGVFPPTFIDIGEPGSHVPEMHVDGGVTTPFFLIPEAMALWKPDHSMRPKSLYVILNGKINSSYAVTEGAVEPILLRTFDTLGRAQMRSQIIVAEAFAERNGGTLAYTVIPDDKNADPFDFSSANTSALFQIGFERASAGKAFLGAGSTPFRKTGMK